MGKAARREAVLFNGPNLQHAYQVAYCRLTRMMLRSAGDIKGGYNKQPARAKKQSDRTGKKRAGVLPASRRFMRTPLGPVLHPTTSLHKPCVVRHSKKRRLMAEMGRCCRKRFFWQVNQIFQHRRCVRRAPMRGTTSNHKKATTELRTRQAEACRSGGRQTRSFARFRELLNFRLFSTASANSGRHSANGSMPSDGVRL